MRAAACHGSLDSAIPQRSKPAVGAF